MSLRYVATWTVAAVAIAAALGRPAAAGGQECPATPPPVNVTAAMKPVGPVQAACFASPAPDRACFAQRHICETDMAVARIAWKYFENNYQAATGLVNAADQFPSTTMWDAASALAGTIAARELDILPVKEFDDRITAFLATLRSLKMFQDKAPNKAYNTQTAVMSDYTNKPSDGIGFSALDLARLASWLNNLGCLYPRHARSVEGVLARWKYESIVHDGQMWGVFVDPANKKAIPQQEGRLGYEQYAGKVFSMLGFDEKGPSSYKNEFTSTVTIYGVPIAYDTRDPRKLGAYNFVVTESYALDAMEFGVDESNAALVRNIYEVQKRRWQQTGAVTAVSEDNIDRPPYFLYNTIYAAGSPWNTVTDTGADHDELKTVSVKAAFALAALFPGDPYSGVLLDKVGNAYDAAKGYYSGIYESGLGYNKAITANTNGIILEALLFKKRGPLDTLCARCARTAKVVVPAQLQDCACSSKHDAKPQASR